MNIIFYCRSTSGQQKQNYRKALNWESNQWKYFNDYLHNLKINNIIVSENCGHHVFLFFQGSHFYYLQRYIHKFQYSLTRHLRCLHTSTLSWRDNVSKNTVLNSFLLGIIWKITEVYYVMVSWCHLDTGIINVIITPTT